VARATQRVFFALWPDAQARAQLAGLAREVALESGGRPTPPDRIHLTLAFVGEQPTIRVDSLCRLGGLIRARDFVLALSRIGGFSRTGVAWLGAATAPAELAALHAELTGALRSRGFPVDERAYAPHLTLARHSTTVVERTLPQPISWRATSFSLVASDPGSGGPAYRSIAAWPLVSL
jgi:RNA 2',3'-cyclic 3'-phosphodiesterase